MPDQSTSQTQQAPTILEGEEALQLQILKRKQLQDFVKSSKEAIQGKRLTVFKVLAPNLIKLEHELNTSEEDTLLKWARDNHHAVARKILEGEKALQLQILKGEAALQLIKDGNAVGKVLNSPLTACRGQRLLEIYC